MGVILMCEILCGICRKEITEEELINEEVILLYQPDSHFTEEIIEYEHKECARMEPNKSNQNETILTYWSVL
jgi:hypothetical protein